MESRERIRMRELELQQERLTRTDREPENDDGNDSASSHGSAASSTRRRSRAGPKLPYFDDAKNNIDSYLLRALCGIARLANARMGNLFECLIER